MATVSRQPKAHAPAAAGADPLEALPFDALALVCDRMGLCTLVRFAATCRAAERAVDDATEGALGALRASRLPAGCTTLAKTCAALHCTPQHVRQLPAYKPSAAARVTLVGVLEGLRASKGHGWAAVRSELSDASERSDKGHALAAQREAARRARLKRLDAWFAGVADAAAAARAAGTPLLDVPTALERAAARTTGTTGAEKKWGALCTLSVETGEVVYPPIALGHGGHGAGVCSFDEWAHWLHGTTFARLARVPLPKCVEAYACSEVLGAEPFVRVTLALLAFDVRVRRAAAFEEAVQELFASKRLCVPSTWRVSDWRAAFWEAQHTGCATPHEAAEAITRDAVAGLYDAEKARMLYHRRRHCAEPEPHERTPFIALTLSPATGGTGGFASGMWDAGAWPSSTTPLPSTLEIERLATAPSPSPEELAEEEDAFMAMLGEVTGDVPL